MMYQMSQGYSAGSIGYTSRSSSALEQAVDFAPLRLETQGFSYASAVPASGEYLRPSVSNSSVVYNPGVESSLLYNSSVDVYSIVSSPHIEYHFDPNNFLKPGMHGTFVGKIEEIKEHITDTFEKMFDTPFPTDLKLSLLDKHEFEKIAPGKGTIGISFNRRQSGLISEIFVLNGSLARVMLTIGHELGHVLTPTLGCAKTEEAKAFAFSHIWMNTIKEHNIAGLADAFIVEQPAINGLHNVAFDYVAKLIARGKSAADVYGELIGGTVAVGM
jgi:hypothetical protein